jgi:dolichol-phosphate mannosyltransferase
VIWAGFSQCFIPYHRGKRNAGTSKWSMAKKLKLFADSFVSFSFFPMRLISTLGGIVSALGLLWAAVIFVRATFWRLPVQGWASLIITVLMLSGLQLLMLGIISEYLWRALEAARNRPLFIIKEVDALNRPRTPAETLRDG